MEWPEGLSAREGAALLESRGLVHDSLLMAAYLWFAAPLARPQPGQHWIRDNLSPKKLLEHLARMRSRPRQSVALPEGWNHVQIATRLEERGICSGVGFRAAVFSDSVRRRLGVSGPSLEGYLFPDTYEFFANTDPESVAAVLVAHAKKQLLALRRAHGEQFAALEQDLGWHDLQVLTLASIVEKEAASAMERPIIASVFLNRLRSDDFRPFRMLQSDPTAGYGCLVEPDAAPSCAEYDRRITPAMLRDALNRYNTYKHPGLPPGPIANPGLDALRAVLQPQKTDYFFFVARGQGRHVFSRSYDEHSSRVRSLRNGARSAGNTGEMGPD